jgi:hypothetical protein
VVNLGSARLNVILVYENLIASLETDTDITQEGMMLLIAGK